MSLTIELLPDLAANDLRLQQLVQERASPLERLNLLHGSALQRLSSQRMLAEASGGGLAAVYGFTPVDIAQAAALHGDAPPRHRWPPGADLAVLSELLPTLSLQQFDPAGPGLAGAMLRALTDLREAALSPDDLPRGDLQTVFRAWRETVGDCNDRTARYEDAVSPITGADAYRAALGDAPLVVSGMYDLTRIQRLLLGRIADATDVRMLLVAPFDDPQTLPMQTAATLQRETGARIVRSKLSAMPLAPDHYFSVGDPTAEADEIARLILEMANDGLVWRRAAVFHQLGAPADDRICAALERADVPSWRIAGRQLSLTSIGRATLGLVELLLDPDRAQPSECLDWLSHRALRARPLNVVRRPVRWEPYGLELGRSGGLHALRERLRTLADDTSDATDGLETIIADLSDRARALATSQSCQSWQTASARLVDAFDTYLDESSNDTASFEASRETLSDLRDHDQLGRPWVASEGLMALRRAFGGRVVRDPRRLVGGVNVGAAAGPARGIRYDAVFAADVAERIFPAVARQDSLFSDAARSAINRRVPNALPLQRDRADTDRHVWSLMRRAARQRFVAGWSRRSSAIGGPSHASNLLLEAASATLDPADAPYSESDLSQRGRIRRLPSAATTVTPGPDQVVADDWRLPLSAGDLQSLDLALLSAPGVDGRALSPLIWPAAEQADHARRRRNASQFTEFDGLLDRSASKRPWRPLEQAWSASALETYVTCPYQFFLQHVLHSTVAEAAEAADRPNQRQHAQIGELARRALREWSRRHLESPEDQTWRDYAAQAPLLREIAARVVADELGLSEAEPPAVEQRISDRVCADLEHVRRRELSESRDGWRPIAVSVDYSDATVRVSRNRRLRLRGRIDRIDQHRSGRQRAMIWVSGSSLPDPSGFVNGSSLEAIAALAALQERGVAIRDAEVVFQSIGAEGHLAAQRLRGELLTTQGGVDAPSAAERLRDTLTAIADGLEAANFIATPGQPPRDRPNCANCAYDAVCASDIGHRFQHKLNRHPEPVRALEIIRRRRAPAW